MKQSDNKKSYSGPIDVTEDAENLMGDLSGRYGVTQSSRSQDGNDLSKQDQKLYDKAAFTGMTETKAEDNLDNATEDEMIDRTVRRFVSMDPDMAFNPLTDQTPDNRFPTTEDAGQNSPDNWGEQDAAGGSATDPDTDDDIDEIGLRTFGETPEEAEEIPNLADQIDRGEKAFHDS